MKWILKTIVAGTLAGSTFAVTAADSAQSPELPYQKLLLGSAAAAKNGVTLIAATSAATHTNAGSNHLLLIDKFGNSVRMSTNDVHSSLHPPGGTGLERQIPNTPNGAPLSDEVLQRIAESKTRQEGVQWFPATPPVLMPYLANQDEFGNTAIQPGALFSTGPMSQVLQAGKYWLSGVGLRYDFYQSLTMVSMTDVASGSSALQYYSGTFLGKWALYEGPKGFPAGWLSAEADIQLGLSPSSRNQSPSGNLATIANPLSSVDGPDRVWLSELAWQQSLMQGQLVIVAGMVDQSNYLDANSYANNSHGQFLNSALVNSSVLPFPNNNLGLNLQWQPNKSWYLLLGTGANNQAPGTSPFRSVSLDNWSYLVELGLTPKDVLGLGPGNYRIQPFLATVGGQTQPGMGLNIGQRLGRNSPVAYFGRFGVGGSQVTLGGAKTQVATGFAMQTPLKLASPFHKVVSDYLGAGFIWSQPSRAMQPAAHQNEYGLEAIYVLQVTPFASIQPDLQIIWDAAGNPKAERNVIFQLQFNLIW